MSNIKTPQALIFSPAKTSMRCAWKGVGGSRLYLQCVYTYEKRETKGRKYAAPEIKAMKNVNFESENCQ